MIRLSNAISAWGSPAFVDHLKHDIEQLPADALPLQQGMRASSYVTDSQLKVMIIAVVEHQTHIIAKAGIFFSGIIAGCSCADDPTPIDENSEYCELQFDIDKVTGETSVKLLD